MRTIVVEPVAVTDTGAAVLVTGLVTATGEGVIVDAAVLHKSVMYIDSKMKVAYIVEVLIPRNVLQNGVAEG